MPPPPRHRCYRRNAISSSARGQLDGKNETLSIRNIITGVVVCVCACAPVRLIVRCLNDDDRKAKTLRRRRGVLDEYLPHSDT